MNKLPKKRPKPKPQHQFSPASKADFKPTPSYR